VAVTTLHSKGIRFLFDVLGGEGLTRAKSAPPPPEPSKTFIKTRFLAATGVLVTQSSGMAKAKSSACRSGATLLKLGTTPDRKVSKVDRQP